MTKRTNEKSKTGTASTHPETQRSTTVRGAPGTASSKVPHTEKDTRSNHDKDGNDEQRAPR